MKHNTRSVSPSIARQPASILFPHFLHAFTFPALSINLLLTRVRCWHRTIATRNQLFSCLLLLHFPSSQYPPPSPGQTTASLPFLCHHHHRHHRTTIFSTTIVAIIVTCVFFLQSFAFHSAVWHHHDATARQAARSRRKQKIKTSRKN